MANVEQTSATSEAELLEVILHRPGTRRKADHPEKVVGKAVDPGVTVSVDLFKSSESYRKLARQDGRIRKYLARQALPVSKVFKSGYYLVPKAQHKTISAGLEEKLAAREKLREEFLAEYGRLKRTAAPGVPFPEKEELEGAFQAKARFRHWNGF